MVISRTPTPHPYRRKVANNGFRQKNDIKEYCKDMFQRSLLTGVPQIVAAQSTSSKVFKTFVFLGSIAGFLYQTSAFLKIYFSYPTFVDVQVTTPPFVDVPSITICNRNGLRRSEYCRLKPENCAPLKQLARFCENHPETCVAGKKFTDALYPTPKAYEEEHKVMQEVLQKIGHRSYPLISECRFRGAKIYDDICKNDTFTPFIFQDIYGRMKLCYILNARWSKRTLNLPKIPVRATLEIILDLEPHEYFRMNQDVAAQVVVHSPWTVNNPFTEGFTVFPQKAYILHNKETIKNLLPWPYQTNCTDYIKAWSIRGENGPLSKEMCVEECLLNQTMDACKCVLTENLYPHRFNFCSSNTDFCTNAINYTHCFVKCSPACHSRHFEVDVSEESIEVDMEDSLTMWNKTVKITIIFKQSQVNIYTYRAKYESIEMFSFLGGYVGIWLGISLIALLDFLESLAAFMVFAIDRMKHTNRAVAIRSAISRRTTRTPSSPDDNHNWAVPVRF